ncbi:NYN domain-containing protein [Mesorhizobium calcicola]|uniref:NYN domain-containing protein n=1 Tax=Mesorhizobium calcicola TaxID=1300310 RepID=A0ABW4WPA7_9HYPH
MRGAAYVDGFNLYHGLDELNQPYLKWLNLWRLAEIFRRGHADTIEKVVFCTATFKGDTGKSARHRFYMDALRNVNVEIRMGHEGSEYCHCNKCQKGWYAPREKETDINVAMALYDDAIDNLFDVAFLVTGDTDQAATMKSMAKRFPDKRIIIVAPPNRDRNTQLKDLAYNRTQIKITTDMLDLALFPGLVTAEGKKAVVRPAEYAPPAGWIHPDDRPQKAKIAK